MHSESSFSQGRTILLVEDEKPVRRLITTVLRRAGYNVLEADGPNEATALWAANSATVDLLFADIVMPTLSGPELARKFLVTRPDLRIIFSSGNSSPVFADSIDVIEHQQFLQKPYDFEQLLSAVATALRPA
jgi:two-component system cell cycle sensor histidine kinase/response regulator CckA